MRLPALPILLAAGLSAQSAPPAPAPAPAPAVAGQADKAWKYEADLDISGRSGNVNSSGLAAGIRATGERPKISQTSFSLRGNTATQEGVKSADELRGQAAYERTLAEKSFWYVRADAGYDNVRDLDLIALGSAGFGRRFFKDDKGSLDLRAGLGYRQEESSGASEDISAPAFDAGLSFERDLGWGQLRIQLDLVPSLEDLADLSLRHEASLELLGGKESPISLRIGLLQDYRSDVVAPVEKLQNTYFVRLVYRWQ